MVLLADTPLKFAKVLERVLATVWSANFLMSIDLGVVISFAFAA